MYLRKICIIIFNTFSFYKAKLRFWAYSSGTTSLSNVAGSDSSIGQCAHFREMDFLTISIRMKLHESRNKLFAMLSSLLMFRQSQNWEVCPTGEQIQKWGQAKIRGWSRQANRVRTGRAGTITRYAGELGNYTQDNLANGKCKWGDLNSEGLMRECEKGMRTRWRECEMLWCGWQDLEWQQS